MKKILFIVVVAIVATTTSCRKDLTCTCTFEQSNATTTGSVTNTTSSTGKTTAAYTSVKKRNVDFYDKCESRTEVNTTKNGSGSFASTSVETIVYNCELN